MDILLSTAYFGPVEYYSSLRGGRRVLIEGMENFPKQTYRNRCIIYGANGPLTLSVPVNRGNQPKILTKEIKIDYSSNWQKIHFRAIESAYRNSPYYEYYIDEFIPFFYHHFNYLIDFNNEILAKTCSIIGIPLYLTVTNEFIKTVTKDFIDLRFNINPKNYKNNNPLKLTIPEYRQVFSPKSGYIANLSIIDLIFNTGPDAINYLAEYYET